MKTSHTALTDAEAVDRLAAKVSRRTPGPKLTMDFDEDTRHLTVEFNHDDKAACFARSMVELGTSDSRVFDGFFSQLSALGESGHSISERATNFALGVVASIEPRDEVEAMLAAQMAVTHQASMMMGRRLNHVTTIPQQDAAERRVQ
ncbi:hypothetical protein [uncultured Boseongicola sp.]|uniref:hypothetical protein n=1 Tax=uncultured Boseongicola sp. TaxID=1648499 RepID=UPI002627EAF1|nr:hypothetical protein [uncultured Boseongicola sp.]